jgi:hypothetical protein
MTLDEAIAYYLALEKEAARRVGFGFSSKGRSGPFGVLREMKDLGL